MAPKNYLENRRNNFETSSRVDGMSCNCTSEIKMINNYSGLITTIDSRDRGVFFFSSVNRHNTANVNGCLYYLRYLNGDKAKTSKLPDELITLHTSFRTEVLDC